MRKYSNTLDVRKFEKVFSSLIRLREDKEAIIKDVVARIEAAKADIGTFLKNVDEIEDKKVQKCCRYAAIAQLYNVKPESMGGYPYIARQAYGDVFLIIFKHDLGNGPFYSTAVVSKYGERIIDEGEISVSTMTNYGNGAGWIFKRVGGDKYGLISDFGKVLVPCLFDSCYTNVGVAYCFHKGVSFELTVYGKQGEIDDDNPGCLICRSESGVLYTLRAEHVVRNPSTGEDEYPHEVASATYQDAVREVKAFMSPFIVTQE